MSELNDSMDEASSDSIEYSAVEDQDSDEENISEASEDHDEEENIDVWNRLQEKAMERHQETLGKLTEKYLKSGDGIDVAEIKANNDMIPVYRKELREVLFEQLKWFHFLKRDPIYKKIMTTKQNLVDMENYGWEEATESAIHQRKYLLNKLFQKEEVTKQNHGRFHPYSRPFYFKKPVIVRTYYRNKNVSYNFVDLCG